MNTTLTILGTATIGSAIALTPIGAEAGINRDGISAISNIAINDNSIANIIDIATSEIAITDIAITNSAISFGRIGAIAAIS